MRKIGLRALLVVVLMLAAFPASAEQATPSAPSAEPASAPVPQLGQNPPPAPEPYVPFLAITWSPIHLALPVIELTGEVRVMPKMGLALLLGAGSVTVEETVPKTKVSVFEIGGQFRYYVLGDFRHGMQLGAELAYLHASGSTTTQSAIVAGTAVGPFAGYKFTAGVGFTFEAQLGVQRMFLAGESSNGNTASESKFIPLLNLNVGWSF
jgi:hypothetical protein